MKKIFAKNAFQNQAKNKAEEAVQKYARELDGTLIYGGRNIKVFVERFEKTIDEICATYPRCRYIETSYRYYENSGHWISAGDVARINFYDVKQEFPEKPETFINECKGKETPDELSNCIEPDVSVSLLERAEMLISDTHEYWHRDYERWRNER